jgi:small-conductance mechanosensitive channel
LEDQGNTEVVGALSDEVDNAWSTLATLVDGFFAMLPKLAIALVVFTLFYVVAMGVRRIVRRVASTKNHQGLGNALGRLAHLGVVFAGFLAAVGIIAPSVGAAELLSILGVGSVAIGFAFRDILQNFLAGILILLREPFSKGDWVQLGDHEGIVTAISTRSTWIRTFDGRDIAIPNGEVFTNAMTVVTRTPTIRAQYEFGVAYDTDLDRAMEVILDAVRAFSTVLDDPAPDAGVADLAGSSVNIRARWWTTNDDFYRTKLDVIKAVKEALDEAGIDIPFPQRQLLFDAKELLPVTERSHSQAAE